MKDREQIKTYLFAGTAIFSLYSRKINKRVTYRVKRDKYAGSDWCTVATLYGPDNEFDYRTIGVIKPDGTLLISHKDLSTAEKMIKQFLSVIFDSNAEWPETMVFEPSDFCAVCGKRLTRSESLKYGIGPSCLRRLNIINGGKNAN